MEPEEQIRQHHGWSEVGSICIPSVIQWACAVQLQQHTPPGHRTEVLPFFCRSLELNPRHDGWRHGRLGGESATETWKDAS